MQIIKDFPKWAEASGKNGGFLSHTWVGFVVHHSERTDAYLDSDGNWCGFISAIATFPSAPEAEDFAQEHVPEGPYQILSFGVGLIIGEPS